ncbi:hypothetical protein K9U39_04515 [Rhodoblastus acidophilus]|uniref:Uncharacterized protein n=1 Tax=Candidatus Rhodoblastus alkanivorans TaxID=2954117 RepID=A0ABS9Z5E8_9HYPH|nr:hypothetical protein [Candidatus Rhodoblastus alkanivorans]MCI4678423.1 hypothetical protein [Candidatus Rhodoblastus alkanivorans]MCI4682904.1 hypothetical protein [Candidatus Rhodoblastus alkanivorans]MDI4640214.1 hypothetical protein [Rhodoblastus acidophilus]
MARSRQLQEMSVAPGLRWRLRRGLGFLARTARRGLRAALPFETPQVLAVAPHREA